MLRLPPPPPLNKQKRRTPCVHLNTIADYKEDSKICIDCGCVIGRIGLAVDTFDRMSEYSTQRKIGSVVNKRFKSAHQRAERNAESLTERRLTRVTRMLDDLCDEIGVTQLIKRRATFLIEHILTNRDTIKQVKKDELLCAVCVYMGLREQQVPLTYREVAHHCKKVKPKEICRIFKIYERHMCMVKKPLITCASVNYKMMVPRFCGLLGIDFFQQKLIRRRMTAVDKKCVSLKSLNPMTKFAVAVRLEFGERVSVDDLHLVCGVSKHTILKSVALFDEIDRQV